MFYGTEKKHIYGSQKNGSILSIFIIRKIKKQIGHFYLNFLKVVFVPASYRVKAFKEIDMKHAVTNIYVDVVGKTIFYVAVGV